MRKVHTEPSAHVCTCTEYIHYVLQHITALAASHGSSHGEISVARAPASTSSASAVSSHPNLSAFNLAVPARARARASASHSLAGLPRRPSWELHLPLHSPDAIRRRALSPSLPRGAGIDHTCPLLLLLLLVLLRALCSAYTQQCWPPRPHAGAEQPCCFCSAMLAAHRPAPGPGNRAVHWLKRGPGGSSAGAVQGALLQSTGNSLLRLGPVALPTRNLAIAPLRPARPLLPRSRPPLPLPLRPCQRQRQGGGGLGRHLLARACAPSAATTGHFAHLPENDITRPAKAATSWLADPLRRLPAYTAHSRSCLSVYALCMPIRLPIRLPSPHSDAFSSAARGSQCPAAAASLVPAAQPPLSGSGTARGLGQHWSLLPGGRGKGSMQLLTNSHIVDAGLQPHAQTHVLPPLPSSISGTSGLFHTPPPRPIGSALTSLAPSRPRTLVGFHAGPGLGRIPERLGVFRPWLASTPDQTAHVRLDGVSLLHRTRSAAHALFVGRRRSGARLCHWPQERSCGTLT